MWLGQRCNDGTRDQEEAGMLAKVGAEVAEGSGHDRGLTPSPPPPRRLARSRPTRRRGNRWNRALVRNSVRLWCSLANPPGWLHYPTVRPDPWLTWVRVWYPGAGRQDEGQRQDGAGHRQIPSRGTPAAPNSSSALVWLGWSASSSSRRRPQIARSIAAAREDGATEDPEERKFNKFVPPNRVSSAPTPEASPRSETGRS